MVLAKPVEPEFFLRTVHTVVGERLLHRQRGE
jgi:hypothetical protein